MKRRIEELPLPTKQQSSQSFFQPLQLKLKFPQPNQQVFYVWNASSRKKLFASKKHQDNLDKQYLNIYDSFLDLPVVSKGLTCRKQPNNLQNSSTKIQNNKFMTIG